MTNQLVFTGKGSPLVPYIAGPDLVEAVNIALFLERPLLLEGEPGCGKTQLAQAVASELGLPLYSWQVRSSSQAQDGVYTFEPPVILDRSRLSNLEPIEMYLHFGPIGQAFRSEKKAVVLIDEIDKATMDFSNDLIPILNAPWEFFIRETNTKIVAVHSPFFVITNNQSQYVLSDAFLRNCILHYIQFPDHFSLREIAVSHFGQMDLPPELFDTAIQFFAMIRRRIADVTPEFRPSIREFLDWLKLLTIDPDRSIQLLQKRDLIPHHQVLLKAGAYYYIDLLLSDNPPKVSANRQVTLIRKQMLEHFSEDEFRTLCLDMDHRFDKLPGESLEGKMREFIALMERQNRLMDLLKVLTAERPHIDWQNL